MENERARKTRTLSFIACGDPHHGFARIYCDACGRYWLLALPARPDTCVRAATRQRVAPDPLRFGSKSDITLGGRRRTNCPIDRLTLKSLWRRP